MLRINNICYKFSEYLAKELNLDENKTKIINYGIFSIIQTIICISLVIIIGTLFNVTIEALIISFIIGILRKSSGGAHADSPEKCAIIGTLVSIAGGAICKKINISLDYMIIVGICLFVWSFYIVYKLVPVDSKAKPINKIEKRERLKKYSYITLMIYLLIIIFNIFNIIVLKKKVYISYSLCIYLGVFWQIFSLTNIGHIILSIFNSKN